MSMAGCLPSRGQNWIPAPPGTFIALLKEGDNRNCSSLWCGGRWESLAGLNFMSIDPWLGTLTVLPLRVTPSSEIWLVMILRYEPLTRIMAHRVECKFGQPSGEAVPWWGLSRPRTHRFPQPCRLKRLILRRQPKATLLGDVGWVINFHCRLCDVSLRDTLGRICSVLHCWSLMHHHNNKAITHNAQPHNIIEAFTIVQSWRWWRSCAG